MTIIQVNNRHYASRKRPVVGVCLDGCAQAYLEAAAAVMPNLQAIQQAGAHGLVKTVIPSFTNPNNMAIVTGATPDVNGISGNFYYDAGADEEVMINDPKYLRIPTILSAFSAADQSVAVVTTKDKLRLFLAKDLQGICFSVERAHEATLASHGLADVKGLVGRANPGIYDLEASVYCLEAGARLLEHYPLDLMYLSTTDYVQHKYAPGSPEANHFYARLDHFLGQLAAHDIILGITADHGMNDKVNPDGSPKVIFVEPLLKEAGMAEARVILPITDPYVVHHGALGSYATVYVDPHHIAPASQHLQTIPGIELVLSRSEAAERFHLPPDHLGDLVILSDQETVLGRTPEWHDLTVVESGLRSHGGLHEGVVPMIINRPLKEDYADRLASGEAKNYDLFDFLCNGVVDE